MRDWKSKLRADPTDWLLEGENPSIRYWTLIDILDHPAGDQEVRNLRKSILSFPPVASLLDAQHDDGHWGSENYYLPRLGLGTFWVLSLLGDMGLNTEDEPIRRGSRFMFAHQRENGAFCRRMRIPGQGMVWQECVEPCTQARIVRFLIQFGYADDLRVQKAIDWLLPLQRDDGMWLCREEGRYGCLRATLDVLRMAALNPSTASLPAIKKAAGAVAALLMEPRMSRYHTGEKWGTWECLRYPYIGFTVISALDALARLGFSPPEPKVAQAAEYLLGRQDPDGSWSMDESLTSSPIDFGKARETNKWITLDAMRVIKRLYS